MTGDGFSMQSQINRVTILVGEARYGASCPPGDDDWTMSLSLLAYIDTADQLQVGKKEMVWTISQEAFEQSAYCLFKSFTANIVEVVEHEDRLELIRLLDSDVSEARLQELLPNDQKPVFYDDSLAGRLTLNRGLGWYEGQVSWAGQIIQLLVKNQDSELTPTALNTLHQLLTSSDSWDKKAREEASVVLLNLAEDWALEDDQPLTQTSFADRLNASCLIIEVDGSWTLECDDDEIFAGHQVHIAFDQGFQFLEANI